MAKEDGSQSGADGSVHRRGFLVGSAAVAGGLALGTGSQLAGDARAADSGSVDSPAPYEKLDPEAVKPAARKNYRAGMHCGEGTFHTVVNQLRDRVGEPYTEIPTSIIWPAAGGGGLQGATCGSLVGGMAAIGLVHGRSSTTMQLTDALFRWYEETALPEYKPPDTAEGMTKALPASKPKSPICHLSVSNWCEAADMASGTPERAERCGRLTSDVTAKTVELLNAAADDELAETAASIPSDPSTDAEHGCRTCHSAGKPKTLGGTTFGKMPCRTCHGNKHGWLGPSERE